LFIRGCASHAYQEMILVLDQEYQDILTQAILGGCHIMLRVREHPRLENCSEILSSHAILVGL